MSTVLITGANRGIGLEFARQYAAGITERSDTAEMLQIVASLRIIAAAIEDFPEFFAKN